MEIDLFKLKSLPSFITEFVEEGLLIIISGAEFFTVGICSSKFRNESGDEIGDFTGALGIAMMDRTELIEE